MNGAWLIAALLLVALVALGLAALGRRRERAARARHAARTLPGSDASDLNTLGLSPVRARDPLPSSRPDPAEPVTVNDRFATDVPSEPAPPPVAPPSRESFDEFGVSVARPAAPRPEPPPEPPSPASMPLSLEGAHAAPGSPLWVVADPDAVVFLLESVAAALGAQSVALLRHDASEDAYAVEALVSRAPEVRTAAFSAVDNALHRVPDDHSISLLEADAFGALRYHAAPEEAVGSAAALAIEGPPARLLLVADRAAGATPFRQQHLTQFGAYADFIGQLLAAMPVPSGDEAPSDAAAPAGQEAAVQEAAVQPRAEIIAEEMASARAEERPLALALVGLRDAEAIVARGADAVASAEAALFERLEDAEGSTRVERFGELLAGVFCHAGPAFVEGWAERVGAEGPPVYIGAALLRARHADAEAFRNDASAALRLAYERREDCVILE